LQSAQKEVVNFLKVNHGLDTSAMKLSLLRACAAAFLLQCAPVWAAADEGICLFQTHAQVAVAKMIHESGTRAVHVDEPPRGVYANGKKSREFLHCSAQRVKEEALEEAGLTCSTLSYYGASVPKLTNATASAVMALKAQLNEMERSKPHKFNFQGTLSAGSVMNGSPKDDRRLWVKEFVHKNFGPDDFLVITDAPQSHQPWGPYDHTNDASNFSPAQSYLAPLKIDASYWTSMFQSRFTLCPGGDGPWSMRFYEAILAGSIPVINSVDDDYSSADTAFWFNQIGYKYFTTDQVVKMDVPEAELASIASQNLDLFFKYQMFTDGDNVPPMYSAAYGGRCLSSSICAARCLHELCPPAPDR